MLSPSRRQFLQRSLTLASFGLVWACGLPSSFGRRSAKVPQIGYLASGVAGGPTEIAFLDGLRELGYVDGQTISVEYRLAEGRVEQLPQLAAELVGLPLALILASGPDATLAAKATATTMPIVMCFGGDPIRLGLVASLAHPGGNITGLAALTSELSAKRLELLTEALPGISRVAVLSDATWDASDGPSGQGSLAVIAPSLKLQLQPLEVRGPADFERAVEAAIAGHAEALFLADSPMISANRRRLTELITTSRLPATASGGFARDFAAGGALLTYAANFPSIYRRAASHVDKILKGAKPADLPVEQPTIFDFIINLKTAQTLGLTILQSVLQQATEVIQ
jgi:putative tryptophan/tyrosine transport system substrate-binding protein